MPLERTGWRRIAWLIGWPIRLLLVASLRAYQRYVSPMFGPSCRYHPCCSAYAITAVNRHGAAKGTLLTGARLVRCNPWSGGGIDPVPRRGRWRSPVDPDGTPRHGRGQARPRAALVARTAHRP